MRTEHLTTNIEREGSQIANMKFIWTCEVPSTLQTLFLCMILLVRIHSVCKVDVPYLVTLCYLLPYTTWTHEVQ